MTTGAMRREIMKIRKRIKYPNITRTWQHNVSHNNNNIHVYNMNKTMNYNSNLLYHTCASHKSNNIHVYNNNRHNNNYYSNYISLFCHKNGNIHVYKNCHNKLNYHYNPLHHTKRQLISSSSFLATCDEFLCLGEGEGKKSNRTNFKKRSYFNIFSLSKGKLSSSYDVSSSSHCSFSSLPKNNGNDEMASAAAESNNTTSHGNAPSLVEENHINPFNKSYSVLKIYKNGKVEPANISLRDILVENDLQVRDIRTLSLNLFPDHDPFDGKNDNNDSDNTRKSSFDWHRNIKVKYNETIDDNENKKTNVHGIQYKRKKSQRKLGIWDDTHLIRPSSCIFASNRKCILAVLPPFKVLIKRDYCLAFDAEDPMVSTGIYKIAKSIEPYKFDEELVERPPRFQEGEDEQDKGIYTSNNKSLYTTIYFERLFLDKIIAYQCDAYNRTMELVEVLVYDTIHEIGSSVTNNETKESYRRFVPIKEGLMKYKHEILELQDVLIGLIKSQDEMDSLLLTERDIYGENGLPNHLHDDLELMLEAYSRQLSVFIQRINLLENKVHSTQEIMKVGVDLYRNTVLKWNLYISVLATGVALFTAVGGTFGMNLPSGLEESTEAFVFVTATAASISLATIIASIYKINTLSTRMGTSNRMTESLSYHEAFHKLCKSMPSIEFAIYKVRQEHENGFDILNDARITYNKTDVRAAIRQNLEQVRYSKVSEMELQLIMELIEDYRSLYAINPKRSSAGIYNRNTKSSDHFISELLPRELFTWGSNEEDSMGKNREKSSTNDTLDFSSENQKK